MAATFLCTTSSARVKTVSGNVTDKFNNDPIENATIHPYAMTVYAVTDSRGFYEISFDTSAATVRLIAEADDYEAQEHQASGEVCNFSLKPNITIPGYVWDAILQMFVALIP